MTYPEKPTHARERTWEDSALGIPRRLEDERCPHGIQLDRRCGLCLIDIEELARKERIAKAGRDYAQHVWPGHDDRD